MLAIGVGGALCEEGVALPEEAHELIAGGDDGLFADAEEGVEADAKGTDAVRVGIALCDSAEARPVVCAEGFAVVAKDPVGERRLEVGKQACGCAGGGVGAGGGRRWGALRLEAKLAVRGAGVVGVLKKLAEYGEFGSISGEDLVDEGALIDRNGLLLTRIVEERLASQLARSSRSHGGKRSRPGKLQTNRTGVVSPWR